MMFDCFPLFGILTLNERVLIIIIKNQINPALEACQRGCEFFSRIEFRNGVQEPLNTLRNCNYSKYYVVLLPQSVET